MCCLIILLTDINNLSFKVEVNPQPIDFTVKDEHPKSAQRAIFGDNTFVVEVFTFYTYGAIC